MELAARLRIVRRLAVLVVVWTVTLMALGSWVKATGSGLACPDWPRCYGEWLPPFPSADDGSSWQGEPVLFTHAQVLYEWAHRAVAALLGIPLLAYAWLALRGRELHRALRFLPAAAVAAVFVQAGLGGGTVLRHNPSWLTTLHLVTATLILVLLTVAACFAHLRPLPPAAPPTVEPPPAQPWGYVYREEPRDG